MRLLGRGWYKSLTGAYEEPPALPVGHFFLQPDFLLKSYYQPAAAKLNEQEKQLPRCRNEEPAILA